MKSYDTVFSRYIQKLPLVNFVFISILKLCTLLRHIMKPCHESSVMHGLYTAIDCADK